MNKINRRAWPIFAVIAISLLQGIRSEGKDTTGLYASRVNVFLGTSGDHGQLSPSASYPFSMLSIGPQTYPSIHAGYEHLAKQFLGFTHNRFEGVGCRGSGGNILITPFTGNPESSTLIKSTESGRPGYYAVSFDNGIAAALTVKENAGIEEYTFPEGNNGITINLAHALANGFIAEEHTIAGNTISGWIESGTTCREGAYRVYYSLKTDEAIVWKDLGNHIIRGIVEKGKRKAIVRIAVSSVDTAHATASINNESLAIVKNQSFATWDKMLRSIKVEGVKDEVNLFYALFYRAMQSPFIVSEKDGSFRSADGNLRTGTDSVFNGWAIWDNYRTQLPLLALSMPSTYKHIIHSISNLYKYGKKDWATRHEPSNSVRTEHAVVALLDAYRKKIPVQFDAIIDSIKKEVDSLDFTHPDKALESSYDTWALSEIYAALQKDSLSKQYMAKAGLYKNYWTKDFKDLNKADIDRMGARGMYQGTIWQYRWLVPYDVKGLIELCGGEKQFIRELDKLFANDYYSATNETDIQVPYLYNATSEPWKSQYQIQRFAKDTVIQMYTDVNVRGVDPIFEKVFNNKPQAFIRGMDDDGGAMSSWYIFAGMGLSQSCVGLPVYYLHVPLFEKTHISSANFTISVKHFDPANRYIKAIYLNGKKLNRNWITHDEISKGGELIIESSKSPDKSIVYDTWISSLKD